MNKVKDFAFKRPILFSIIIFVVTDGVTNLPLDKLFLPFFLSQTSGYIAGAILQSIMTALLVVLSLNFGFARICGLTGIKSWKQCWLYWPLVLFILLQGSNLFDPKMNFDKSNPIKIVFFVIVYLSSGLFEEALIRGTVLGVLLKKWVSRKKGIYLAVIISSLIFGLGHIENYFMQRETLGVCLDQIMYAVFIGVFMAACTLRTKSLWLAMLFHGLFDVVFSLEEITVGWKPTLNYISLPSVLLSIVFFLPFLIYGLFILRKVKLEDII